MRSTVLAGFVSLTFVSVAAADPTWLGGEGPPFVFVADGTGATHPGDTLTLVLSVGGRFASNPTASFHLSVPPALTLVSGDTAKVGPLSAISGTYTLKLLTHDSGAFEITGRLKVEAVGQRDDAGFLMPITVRADSVTWEHSHYTLLESIRGGQRYRYGDWWLLPLDSTETSAVEQVLEARGARARAAQLASSSCRGCAATSGVDSVRFVVIVGPDGKMRDSRLLNSAGTLETEAVAAAREALRASVFKAAWTPGGAAVSDWLYVTIPVRRGH